MIVEASTTIKKRQIEQKHGKIGFKKFVRASKKIFLEVTQIKISPKLDISAALFEKYWWKKALEIKKLSENHQWFGKL